MQINQKKNNYSMNRVKEEVSNSFPLSKQTLKNIHF